MASDKVAVVAISPKHAEQHGMAHKVNRGTIKRESSAEAKEGPAAPAAYKGLYKLEENARRQTPLQKLNAATHRPYVIFESLIMSFQALFTLRHYKN